ncbi:MAG: hypothetical protein P9L99_08125 [Candidatus Lernaella stagnicola]|nr:hypothetical protein [Candidatus Lernaella stagnicola]
MAVEKDTIYYHRAYKRAHEDRPNIARLLFVFVLLLDIVIFIFYPDIVDYLTLKVRNVLVTLGYYPTIFHWKMLWRPIAALDMPTVYPSPLFSVGMLIFSTLLIVVVIAVSRFPRLFAAFLTFLSIVNGVSAAFFILTPMEFPYTIGDFCMLYIGTEVGLWILIPVILAIALYSTPTTLASKVLFIVFNVAYSIIFGTVRYLVFLSAMQDHSVLFMAEFYFIFGPLFDFVYVVGFYTLYVSNLSELIQHSFRRWKWLY